MNTYYQRIDILRQKNIMAVQESVLVLLTALFVAVLLPQVLIRFVYADQNLMEEPAALQYMAPLLLAVGLLQVMATFIGNIKRARQIAQLEKEMVENASNALQIDETEIQELEKIIEQSLATKNKANPASASKSKSTTKTKRAAA